MANDKKSQETNRLMFTVKLEIRLESISHLFKGLISLIRDLVRSLGL